jgi:alpha-galactosidase
MNYLTDYPRLSFLLSGRDHTEAFISKTTTKHGNNTVYVYEYGSGLRITTTLTEYPDYSACEWVHTLENTSDTPTDVISELYDADTELSLGKITEQSRTAWKPDPDTLLTVYNPHGSNCTEREFVSYPAHIFAGNERYYEAGCGRSSGNASAPFFNIHNNGKGAIVAIGWSGRWHSIISATADAVRVRCGIRDLSFRLLPGESIRTSSVVIMTYDGNVQESQNKWRSFIKNELSVLTKRKQDPPFSASIWGGMKTEWADERIDAISEYGIPFTYVWMDAGWYGATTLPTKSEFEGDWSQHTGDWTVSPHIHPNGLRCLSDKVRSDGRKFILWFEPERVIKGTPITKEHPEYFLTSTKNGNLLLDLGNRAAFDYVLELLTERFKSLGVDCYRQDFNTDPSTFWEENDEPDRRGIHQIKHINALYRLWDNLLERFPDLMIDNCASGGRRIDIETLKRSIPLWRSDAQCPANPTPEISQIHTQSFAAWMPYHGTGTGRLYDTYAFRSAYSASMTTNYTFSYSDEFGNDAKKMKWLKQMCEEYRRAQPFFTGDVYPLAALDASERTWLATEWYRPDLKAGLIQVFKRADSPFTTASFKLHGIDEGKDIRIVDADGGEWVLGYDELVSRGFVVNIDGARVAKVYFYSQI